MAHSEWCSLAVVVCCRHVSSQLREPASVYNEGLGLFERSLPFTV